MNLGGSLTRQIEQDATVSEASPHIANIGKFKHALDHIVTDSFFTSFLTFHDKGEKPHRDLSPDALHLFSSRSTGSM
jgi:hypothetical protein